MIQVKGLPPNFDEILKVFPAAAGVNTIFAFGDRIFVPSGNQLPPELLAHEQVHGYRQTESAGGIDKWWRKYLEDEVFRQTEELVAHAVEYRAYCTTSQDRNDRSRYLSQMARRLASPLYRLGMTEREATGMIKKAFKDVGSFDYT